METWLDDLARALGQDPLPETDVEALLGVARDVAHRVERRITPVSTFLLGAAVGRAEAAGTARSEALAQALATLRGLLPEASQE
jgi:hypothetical protein